MLSQLIRRNNAINEANFTRPGYYLVKNDQRFFISPTVNESSLDKVCNRVLSELKGWDYWIDYSHGADVYGEPAWSNCDQTDLFI